MQFQQNFRPALTLAEVDGVRVSQALEEKRGTRPDEPAPGDMIPHVFAWRKSLGDGWTEGPSPLRGTCLAPQRGQGTTEGEADLPRGWFATECKA